MKTSLPAYVGASRGSIFKPQQKLGSVVWTTVKCWRVLRKKAGFLLLTTVRRCHIILQISFSKKGARAL